MNLYGNDVFYKYLRLILENYAGSCLALQLLKNLILSPIVNLYWNFANNLRGFNFVPSEKKMTDSLDFQEPSVALQTV